MCQARNFPVITAVHDLRSVAYICAHTIAVAFKEGKLKELSEEYHITLSQMVLIPGSSGKKELFESEEAQTNGTVSTTRSLPIW